MAQKKDIPVEADEQSFQILPPTATALNAATSKLNQSVNELEENFKKLGLGIPSWVTFGDRGSRDGTFYDYDQIGYAKLGGKWGLTVRNVFGNNIDDRPDKIESWSFNESPRHLRIQAIKFIPELLKTMVLDAIEFTQKLEAGAEEVRLFSNRIADVLSGTGKQTEIRTATPPTPDDSVISIFTTVGEAVANARNNLANVAPPTLYGTRSAK